MATTLAPRRVPVIPAHPVSQAGTSAPWWAHLLWVVGAGLLTFALAALSTGVLRLARELFLVPYAVLGLGYLALYVRWSKVDVVARIRHQWVWGVLGFLVAGAFVVRNVFAQPASTAPTGVELIGALLWLGVVYGTVDALLLSVFPLFGTWQALAALGWTTGWTGRIVSGILAIAASLLVAALYHLGFAEYRNPSLVGPLIGNGVMSLASLLTMNPLAAVGAHIAMHVSAVLHGMETAVQLPPHY